LLPLFLTKEGGEGWGEEEFSSKPRLFKNPSLRLSPHSCLAGREGKIGSFTIL
jgi:hypothetical protein